MLKMEKIKIFIVNLLYVFCISCGYYSFSGGLPPGVKSIAIPTFDDRTSEFGIKERLTEKVTEKFLGNGSLKLADRRVADSILNGTITFVTDKPLTFEISASGEQSVENVKEYRVTISIEVKYENMNTHKVIWEEKISAFGNYKISEATVGRDRAINDAIELLANDILNKTIAGW
jgi:hypothetical protein